MSSVIPITALNSNNIIITKLKFDKNKKPSAIFLNVQDKKGCSFIFESCTMTVAFAATYFGENNKDKLIPEDQRNYSIVFRPNGGNMDIPEESSKMMDFLDDLKNMAIDYGIENSNQNILKKKFDQSQREIMMETSFSYPFKERYQPDGSPYPKTISIKIPRNKDTFLPELLFVRDHLGKIDEITLSDWNDLKTMVPPGAKCRGMIQPILSFVNKQLCFTLRMKQLKVYTNDKITIPKTYAFSDTPFKAVQNEIDNTKINELVVESDEEHTSDIEVDVEEN
jgi:hypothetical protein